MTSERRKRGRPCGTGKDDTLLLHRVADLLTGNSTMTPTSAMRQVLRMGKDTTATLESRVRRLQVKWKEGSKSYMAAASARNAPHREVAVNKSSNIESLRLSLGIVDQEYMDKIRRIIGTAFVKSDAFPSLRGIADLNSRFSAIHEIQKLMDSQRLLYGSLHTPLSSYTKLNEEIGKLMRPFGV